MMLKAGHIVAGIVGLVAVQFAPTTLVSGYLALYKISGKANDCSWSQIVAIPELANRFDILRKEIHASVEVLETDASLGVSRVKTSKGTFWIKTKGDVMDGPALLEYLFAEQAWLRESNPGRGARAGDVVVDVGAHVGTFTSQALQAGAAKVIAVEPDPVNIECLHRNFTAEIAAGKVLVVPEGAWDKDDSMDFHIGEANSGTGSLVAKEGSRIIKVRVRKLDDMLAELGVTKVGFIKMDIEGAERHALAGAALCLKRDRPRLMLDAYHLPDDSVVLPALIKRLDPAYHFIPGPCSLDKAKDAIVPQEMYYE